MSRYMFFKYNFRIYRKALLKKKEKFREMPEIIKYLTVYISFRNVSIIIYPVRIIMSCNDIC